MFCHLTAMQACASMPHSIACLGLPRACSSFSTSSVIIVNEVLVWAFRSSAPSSGTVGPKPLGYCSVSTGGMPRMRLACEERYGKRHLIKYNVLQMKWYKCVTYGNVFFFNQTCSNLDALLTMLGNWKMLGLNFSCMSQRNSTASLVESLPSFATAKPKQWRRTNRSYLEGHWMVIHHRLIGATTKMITECYVFTLTPRKYNACWRLLQWK